MEVAGAKEMQILALGARREQAVRIDPEEAGLGAEASVGARALPPLQQRQRRVRHAPQDLCQHARR